MADANDKTDALVLVRRSQLIELQAEISDHASLAHERIRSILAAQPAEAAGDDKWVLIEQCVICRGSGYKPGVNGQHPCLNCDGEGSRSPSPATSVAFTERHGKDLRTFAAQFNDPAVTETSITRAQWDAIAAFVREQDAIINSHEESASVDVDCQTCVKSSGCVMSKSKSKWKLTYWNGPLDKEVTEGFKSYEDMMMRKFNLQKRNQGWNFRENLR